MEEHDRGQLLLWKVCLQKGPVCHYPRQCPPSRRKLSQTQGQVKSHLEIDGHLPVEDGNFEQDTGCNRIQLTLRLNGQWKSNRSAVRLSALANCTVLILPTMTAPATIRRWSAEPVVLLAG